MGRVSPGVPVGDFELLCDADRINLLAMEQQLMHRTLK